MNNEIFLRAEIDRLEAEVLSLKLDIADLKSELAELKGQPESKQIKNWNITEVLQKEAKTMELISTQRK